MPRSLALKLTLAFLLVSLVGVILVAITSRVITVREFDRLTEEQAKSNFTADVSAYYQAYGDWAGIHQAFRQAGQAPAGDGRPLPLPSRPPPRFGLANPAGVVVLPAGSFRLGQRLPPPVLANSVPLTIDGAQVGLIIKTDAPPPPDPLELQYLSRTNRALVIAAAGAVLVGLIIGVVLARTLTRPLRELTQATRAVARGRLEQRVPVRSGDELGQLAESFNQMSADLAQATQLRRQMTADIAHDLRTPLTVITGYLEALRDGDLQPTPARFEAMHAEAQHLKRLIDDLRMLSLADAGELSLNVQPVDPAELLQGVAAAYEPQAARQKIALEVETGGALPSIPADPERLAQVLKNLVGNALRYTPKQGRIILSAERQGEAVRLQVADTGRGIPAADLPHIFNRFYRADRARSQPGGASGLGLAIAQAIVEAHGGRIEANSVEGQGSTFTLTLPAA